MVIGFLGKGGSGKSTLSTLMALYLHQTDNRVLAIDADHNMDLSYNLGFSGTDGPCIGGTFLKLREEMGVSYDEKTEILFASGLPDRRFTLNPKDEYTAKYSTELKEDFFLIMSGPQNENVLYGSHCSHSLAAPLKIYLPLLNLEAGEYVVVDEKASVDAVTTGIPTGFDLSVVCVEPREHSLRVGKQIIEALRWHDLPYVVVLNKTTDDEEIFKAEKVLGEKIKFFMNNAIDPLTITTDQKKVLSQIKDEANNVSERNISRQERTQAKYKKNLSFYS